MNNPEKTRITALIPHPNTPEVFVVDENGDYPSVEFVTIGTREDTLHALCLRAVGYSASVERRRYDLENNRDATEVEIIYETKPEVLTRANPQEGDGYSWDTARLSSDSSNYFEPVDIRVLQ